MDVSGLSWWGARGKAKLLISWWLRKRERERERERETERERESIKGCALRAIPFRSHFLIFHLIAHPIMNLSMGS
jgi:hypothetical protein